MVDLRSNCVFTDTTQKRAYDNAADRTAEISAKFLSFMPEVQVKETSKCDTAREATKTQLDESGSGIPHAREKIEEIKSDA
jgi:hypothetical protein